MRNEENKLQEKFISLLKEKVSNQPASTIMDILPLEKEAVYRRLRGSVPFSFAEMAKLSTSLGISLDQLANNVTPYRSKCYQLYVRDYTQFNPVDLNMSYNYIKTINMAADNPYSEFGISANTVPLHISLLHLPIYRVYLLKWCYQFGMVPINKLSYSSTVVPQEEAETYSLYLEAIEKIKHTFFIWDSSFLISLINDINFFHKIWIISREEMIMLKQEISNMIDTLEHYADSGKFDSTGNEIETYVSNLNFETSYSYLFSDNISLCMSTAYSLGAFTSQEDDACEDMKNWISGLKKSSILISGVAELDKIIFFNKQREILEKKLVIN